MCRVCSGTQEITLQTVDHVYVVPCPGCTRIIPWLMDLVGVKLPTKKGKKIVTVVKDAGYYCVDPDDDTKVEICDVEVEDTLTDTTVDDLLRGEK